MITLPLLTMPPVVQPVPKSIVFVCGNTFSEGLNVIVLHEPGLLLARVKSPSAITMSTFSSSRSFEVITELVASSFCSLTSEEEEDDDFWQETTSAAATATNAIG